MLRPCLLVVDREHSGSISTRKLVLESAKFNVITAYSGQEAIDSFKKFPNVDGIILDVGILDMHCSDLIARLKETRSDVAIIAVGNLSKHPAEGATHRLDSFHPEETLALVQQLFPGESAAIEERERELEEV